MDSPFAPDPRELRLAARLGFVKEGRLRAGKLAAVLVAVTWLPLLILTLVAGSAYGSRVAVPFLADFLPHGRYLVALPLLVLIHPFIGREAALAITRLRGAGIVAPADDSTLSRRIRRGHELWHGRAIRLSLLGIIVVTTMLTFKAAAVVGAPDWMLHAGPDTLGASAAGWWNAVISAPLFRLMVLITLWKLVVWSWFLIQLARMPLIYQPMHADGCAGLSVLERVQFGFCGLAAAFSVQFGCVIADAVAYRGYDIASFRLQAAVFVALMLLLQFAPAAAFIRPLALACTRAEQAFHVWFSQASGQVATSLQQTSGEAIASRLSSQDISALTDATALYTGALRTRKIPVTRRALIAALTASVVPMFIPLLPLLPLKQIAGRLVKVVL